MALNQRGMGALLAVVFAGFVLYATVASAPEAPEGGEGHDAAGAVESCLAAVRARVPDGRFPFSADADYRGGALYRVHGMVDSRLQGAKVRRNYECLVRAAGSAYRADSVRVWQSH